MTIDAATMISIAAILVMLVCLYQVVALRESIPGGVVGKRWRVLTMLVGFFTLGYLSTPFFATLPVESIRLIVALVFLFGAIYVLVTVRLVYQIIRELAG